MICRFYGWTYDYVDTLPMPVFDECALGMIMLRNAELSESYGVSMHPHLKNGHKRTELHKQAIKNSEMYLETDDNDNKEPITMESIYQSLTGAKK